MSLIEPKRLKKGLVLGSLIAFVLSVPVFAGTKGMVTGDYVNLRWSNSTDAEIYDMLFMGHTVDIIEQQGDFYLINHDGKNLYISAEYVSLANDAAKINAFTVNIRRYPTTKHEVLAQADMGDSFVVIGKYEDWVNIVYEGESAFVHRDFIDVPSFDSLKTVTVDIPANSEVSLGIVAPAPLKDEVYAVVTSKDGLKLRAKPSTDSKAITAYAYGTALDIIADYGDWLKVSLDGFEGYMSSEFITIKQGKRPEASRGQRIIDYAKRFIGTPYVWGGTSLEKGVDCSGFVYSVMKNFGITLNRGSMYQYSNGYPVKRAELQVGDLVFFDTDYNGGISHVGIYMGGGQFIHSSSAKRSWGVTISSLSEDYYIRTYYGACRIL